MMGLATMNKPYTVTLKIILEQEVQISAMDADEAYEKAEAEAISNLESDYKIKLVDAISIEEVA